MHSWLRSQLVELQDVQVVAESVQLLQTESQESQAPVLLKYFAGHSVRHTDVSNST
jgi:hypothetical protein